MQIKRKHAVLLGIGIVIIVGGALTMGLLRVFPEYASGEATAMLKRVYSDQLRGGEHLGERYLLRGIWEVEVVAKQDDLRGYELFAYKGRYVFRVYERTDTVEFVRLERGSTTLTEKSLSDRFFAPTLLAFTGALVILIIYFVWLKQIGRNKS